MRRTLVLLLLCSFACSRKVEEPNPPPPSTVMPSITTKSSDPPLSPRERKEITFRLHNEACQAPVKHINVVNGRKETDPAAIDVLSLCVAQGNVAWGNCVMKTKTKEEVETCTRRLLIEAH